jgi:hypothetical protein
MTLQKPHLSLSVAVFTAVAVQAVSFETVLPDFHGAQSGYAMFRTRITEAMMQGPNFAGHFTLLTFGCGAGCSMGFVADNETGQVYDFPFGGEENGQMQLEYGLNSGRVLVSFRTYPDTDTGDAGKSMCVAKKLQFDNGVFIEEQTIEQVADEYICPTASGMFD